MSNPNTSVNFSGDTPDVQILVDRSTRHAEASMSPASPGIQIAAQVSGNVRVYVKTTQDWNEIIGFIPKKGDICVYSDHGTVEENGNLIDVPGIKIGDGEAYLIDQPFVGEDVAAEILAALGDHAGNTTVHVTLAEKDFWNNKLNCQFNNGNLILNRS